MYRARSIWDLQDRIHRHLNGLAMSNEKKFHERIMGPWRLGGEMDFWVVLEETVES